MDSDPDIEFIEKDSGMGSLGGSKDETPERRTVAIAGDSNPQVEPESYDDEPDETIGERMIGLTEMFPEPVRRFVGKLSETTKKSVANIYKFSCNASWIFFTSSLILFAPVIFETERAQMEELQKSQQKQVLLGPGSAMSASGSPPMPSIR